MLSDRITRLFRLLQCSNTEIARFAGCSPSNISRLKSGNREPGSGSRSVLRLAEGVYRYADYENMLPLLAQICGVGDTRPEALIPALLAWLYGERDVFGPPPTAVPRSKQAQEQLTAAFGQRLDRIMTLLGISNGQLAAQLNVDDSLVSRYRGGIYYPYRNAGIRDRLAELLYARAEKKDLLPALAELCRIEGEPLDPELLRDWLFTATEEDPSALAESLLRSIDDFTPGESSFTPPPAADPAPAADQYWGTEGLRAAVDRFLTDAAREGGELLLYSDEPMDWMSGDRDYFALWAARMVACVRQGVRIRIVHNIDRVGREMIAAIHGWFPLYVSGMIEPYAFRRVRNARFYHTVFLRPGAAGILGFFPAEAGERRWYDYITDPERLSAMESGYEAMLSCASPLLRSFPAARTDEFWQFYRSQPEKQASLLNGFSLASMPEELLARILERTGTEPSLRERITSFYWTARRELRSILDRDGLQELLALPDRDTVARGEARLNFGAELVDSRICYTHEEYAEHAAAVRGLVEREKNYHLTLLPASPFRDIQLLTSREAVAVLRCREPYTAFVFQSSALSRAVKDYLSSLVERYAADRHTTMETLEALYR